MPVLAFCYLSPWIKWEYFGSWQISSLEKSKKIRQIPDLHSFLHAGILLPLFWFAMHKLCMSYHGSVAWREIETPVCRYIRF